MLARSGCPSDRVLGPWSGTARSDPRYGEPMARATDRQDGPARPSGVAAVLRHRDFRLFWSGAFVSNVGTWMQNAAVPFVIYQLTGSSAWVGLSTLAVLFPGVVLGPVAGTFADRLDRRRVVLASQFGSAIAAFTLAAVWAAGVHRPGIVVALVAAGGVVFGLSMPAWQGFVADLVPRAELPRAVTLNSMQFHGSRAVGPALGGLVLAALGPTWAFVFNGISYLAVVAAVFAVRSRPARPEPTGNSVRRDLTAGFGYARHHRGIATALAVVVAIGFLGNPIVQLAPVFAERIFAVGAGQYGLLTAAFGAGAATGIWLLGRLAVRWSRSQVVLGSLVVLGLAVVGFGLAPAYVVGLVCVLVAGSSAVGSGTLLLTTVQLQVEDAYRGRVLGVYAMAFTASYPIGALVQGALADAIGPRRIEVVVGMVVLALAATLVVRRGVLDALDGAPAPAAAGA
jgi:MFS family permease